MHKAFQLELYAAVTTKTPKLSDVFIRYKTKLLVYGDFCSNLPKAQARIDELCQNEAIRLKIQVGVGRVRINWLFLVFYCIQLVCTRKETSNQLDAPAAILFDCTSATTPTPPKNAAQRERERVCVVDVDLDCFFIVLCARGDSPYSCCVCDSKLRETSF